MNKLLIALCLGVLLVVNAVPTAHSQLSSVVTVSKIAKLYEYQETALNQRMPLFLIHGIGGQHSNNYKWDRFLAYAESHPEFRQRFKIYLFEYDTAESVPNISSAIQKTLRTFIAENDYPQFRVLAFSEGGLVYRNVIQDPVIFNHTEKIITVASPFHGSPLANQKWLSKQMKENTPFSLVRMTRKLSLAIAKKKHPNFEQDFRWEELDFSKQVPTAEKFALKDHQNFITYGSYFGVNDTYHQKLFRSLDIEHEVPTVKQKFKNLFNKHAIFRMVQKNLTAIPLRVKEKIVNNIVPKRFKDRHRPGDEPVVLLSIEEEESFRNEVSRQFDELNPMLIYNDGISPISSSLWLGRYTALFSSREQQHTSTSHTTQTWKALKSLKGKQKARLFHSVDHANWMEGDNLSEENKLSDLLNPDESPKTIFEWFIFDLTS